MPAKLGVRDELGLTLTFLRWIKGWEQEELANAAGVSLSSVQALEQGKRQGSLGTLGPLTVALGVPLSRLDELVALIRSLREGGPAGPTLRQPLLPPGAAAATIEPSSRFAVAQEVASIVLASLGERGARRIATDLTESRAQAPALWARLASYPPAGQDAVVREAPEFQTLGLCELLCEESIKAAGDSAGRAVQLAELAVLVAQLIDAGAGLRDRVEGYARVHLANSFRVAGDLARAAEELARALALWAAGDADDPGLLNAARVLQIEASLRSAQHRPEDAVELLDRALAIDRWGETPSLLIGKAKAVEDLGRFADAIALLRQVEPLVDGEREPRQLFLLRLNLAVNLCHLGRHAEAQLRFPDVRALAFQLGNRLDLLRVEWLRGRLAAGLGHPGEAVAAFAHVRDELTGLGIAYDAALVTVELAEAHAALGHTAQVKALAQESVPTFHAQGVHHEAQRALDLFVRAAADERLSTDLLRAVIAYLYRARHNPRLRFAEV
jgi:transcriptional regulator with XRE-family HTH domain